MDGSLLPREGGVGISRLDWSDISISEDDDMGVRGERWEMMGKEKES